MQSIQSQIINTRPIRITVPDSSLRRTDNEVRGLVVNLKERIYSDQEFIRRVRYFWPSEELQEQLLFAISKDIPRDDSPIEDPTHYRLQFAIEPIKYGGTYNDCCAWLGPINKYNYCPAIKVHIPDTYEPWITYTVNVLAYLFGKVSGCSKPSEFIKQTNLTHNEPFKMICGNRRCVRVSHIAIKKGTKGISFSEVVDPSLVNENIDKPITSMEELSSSKIYTESNTQELQMTTQKGSTSLQNYSDHITNLSSIEPNISNLLHEPHSSNKEMDTLQEPSSSNLKISNLVGDSVLSTNTYNSKKSHPQDNLELEVNIENNQEQQVAATSSSYQHKGILGNIRNLFNRHK
ncbi:uncharacterized protein CMU_018530 [Cryptosporidium muris RN66]|uniref:Uncharacterized protein n=1 Tax=Cryptosporidium muris (strain RN66) TaxID=441375 RepID=B6AD92_CRYMR|nr:uncharacterized protein CMU_018530 [Cryptosporidium muris RN66]EEA06096.1 hypothetical protein, conserved [Cryptosporidium muris RN66]|eukprot:XP_002140445.1 hypothetical protein [Cryptosporidium muris RN66]